MRRALTDIDAVAVDLESGSAGFALPGDGVEDQDVGEWAALLPVLDPTTMGWTERGF